MTELYMLLQHNCTVVYATHQRSSMELTTDQRTLRTAGSYLKTNFTCLCLELLICFVQLNLKPAS